MDILSELWLHGICKYEPGKVENVSSVLGNEEINPLSSPANVLKARGMEGEIVDRALDPELWEEARRIEEYCCNNGIRIITKAAPEYPELLKNIKIFRGQFALILYIYRYSCFCDKKAQFSKISIIFVLGKYEQFPATNQTNNIAQ